MAYTKYSLTPANNTAAPPDGAPEGMLPSAVNDTMRDMMAQIRDVGDGVRDGTYTMTAPKITGGTITGVTLTGNTFSSPVITGATLTTSAFNGTVGATTASTGAFTTLTSNGATTFTAGTASTSTTTGTTVITGGLGVSGRVNAANFDGIVGANTAAAGSFTTINASTSITNAGLTSGRVTYAGASGLLSDSANFVYDSSERLIVGASSAAIGNRMEVVSNTGSQAIGIRGRVSDGAGVISWHPNASATEYARIQSDSNSALIFGTSSSGTERMRITSTGLVGIGTTSPVATLQVKGSGTSGQVTASFILENSSSGTGGMDITGSAGASRWRFLYGGGPSTGTNALTEAMCIGTEGTNAGRVGIGTSSPSATLDLVSPTNGYIAKFKGQSTYGYIAADNSSGTGGGAFTARQNGVDSVIFGCEGAVIGNTSIDGAIFAASVGGSLKFYTNANATPKVTIDSSGNLEVGTTTANSGIKLFPSFSSSGSSGININHVSTAASGEYYVVFQYNANIVGYISQNGTTAVAYNTTSDYRLKEDIAPMTGALAKVAQLKPVTYKWKTDGSDGQGFIAHELAEVIPDCVTGEKDAVDADGKPIYQGVDTSFLVATLVSAIQELKAEVDSLKQQLNGA